MNDRSSVLGEAASQFELRTTTQPQAAMRQTGLSPWRHMTTCPVIGQRARASVPPEHQTSWTSFLTSPRFNDFDEEDSAQAGKWQGKRLQANDLLDAQSFRRNVSTSVIPILCRRSKGRPSSEDPYLRWVQGLRSLTWYLQVQCLRVARVVVSCFLTDSSGPIIPRTEKPGPGRVAGSSSSRPCPPIGERAASRSVVKALDGRPETACIWGA